MKTPIFQTESNKSPRPYTFPSFVFPKILEYYWHPCTDFIQDIFRRESLLANLNDSLLALIPMVSPPEQVSQFNPVALCNVLMKIITKVLANRLKSLIPKLVLENQSSFVAGKQDDADNIIFAQEVIHSMKKNGGGDKMVYGGKN